MFYRTRTIKGRQYLYEETRYREGGKVRSRSRLIRAVGEFIAANFQDPERGIQLAMEKAEKEKAAMLPPSPSPTEPAPPPEQSPGDASPKVS